MRLCIKGSGAQMKFPTNYYSSQMFLNLIAPSSLNTGGRWSQRPGHFFPNEKGSCLLSSSSSSRINSACLIPLLTQSWNPHTLLHIHSKLILLETGGGGDGVKTGKIVLPQENKAIPRSGEEFTGKLKSLPTFILECFLSMYYMYKKM